MTGLDPEGCDILLEASGGGTAQARRISFGVRVLSPSDARRELARLAKDARTKSEL